MAYEEHFVQIQLSLPTEKGKDAIRSEAVFAAVDAFCVDEYYRRQNISAEIVEPPTIVIVDGRENFYQINATIKIEVNRVPQ